MTNKESFIERLSALVASRKFYHLVLAVLVVQAAWIALSGQYPMAFDEDFHLGIIRLFAHHISPFWSAQPPNADAFGAVVRDPSYLYQYLMSFPYRLISLFTSNLAVMVITLRFISIGLFTWGVVLLHRLMNKTKVSPIIINVCLLIFVLLPVTSLLAAQINYDNLLLPMVGLSLLLTLRFDEVLVKKKRIDTQILIELLSVCLLASLVTYVFLPIFAAIVGYSVVRFWQHRRDIDGSLWLSSKTSFDRLSPWSKVALSVGLAVAAILFIQRIGVNLVEYHTPTPACNQVLSVKDCSQYGPWFRDYTLGNYKGSFSHSPIIFTWQWLYGMWSRTFFAVGGANTNFDSSVPLLLPGWAAIVLAPIGALGLIVGIKRILKKYNSSVLWLLISVIICYVGALWIDEYQEYLATGQPVAINGRYLVPIMLPLLVMSVACIALFTKRWRKVQVFLLLIPVVCLVWGGGALTFILRSSDSWYWNNSLVRVSNHAVKDVIGPIVPGYRHSTKF